MLGLSRIRRKFERNREINAKVILLLSLSRVEGKRCVKVYRSMVCGDTVKGTDIKANIEGVFLSRCFVVAVSLILVLLSARGFPRFPK